MNKGKFASLIMLGAFSAGVVSSSAVSAHADKNFASVVDNIGTSSHDDSVSIDPKVSNEPVVAADETKIDTETTTDEETKNAITDENNDARDDTENLDKNIENKADSPEDLDKENKEDTDYIFIGDKIEKSEDDECKKIRLAKVLAIAAGGGTALGGATVGISKLVKSSRNDKKDEPSPETNPESDKPTGSEEKEKEPEKKEEKNPSEKPKEEEKVGFVEWFWTWYKNNLGLSIPLTIISLIIARMIYFELWQQIVMYKIHAKGICFNFDSEKYFGSIRPFFGLWESFTNTDRFKTASDDSRYTITYSGLKRIGINALAAFTLAEYTWWESKV